MKTKKNSPAARLAAALSAALFLAGTHPAPVLAMDDAPAVYVTEDCWIMGLPDDSACTAGSADAGDCFAYRCTVKDKTGTIWYEAKLASGRLGYIPAACCSYAGEDIWSAGAMAGGTKLIMACTFDDAIIRAEPDPNSEIVACGRDCGRMEYLGCTTEQLGMELYRVKLSNGAVGYIRSTFCTIIEEEPRTAETAPLPKEFRQRIRGALDRAPRMTACGTPVSRT